MALEDGISDVLRTPIGSVTKDPSFGFEGLKSDGSTRIGISSEQVFAEQARAALTRNKPDVVFNEIVAIVTRGGSFSTSRWTTWTRSTIHPPERRHRLPELTAVLAIATAALSPFRSWSLALRYGLIL